MKRTPLNRVSSKRAKINKERAVFVAEQLALRPFCEVGPMILRDTSGCTYNASELHEPLTRARAPGADTILSVENSVALCRNCHRWIHDNPAEAERIGLLRSSHG